MKTEKNILLAFILNLSFSIFEIIGGFFTNSVAILSDAIHDFGDALSIGISYFLEKKSKKKPDENYTYGYTRYSILGAFITTMILTLGSIFVIYKGLKRIIYPASINYDGMIVFAIFGVIVNFLAAYFTKDGHSLNQKAVNLHMLEDVLGWVIVLIGSILIKFTNIVIIDSIMSIFVAIFILIHANKNLKMILDLFLGKVPNDFSVSDIKKEILKIQNVIDIHHIHIWSMDGVNNYLTMHVVTDSNDFVSLKKNIRNLLQGFKINHVTIEIENKDEKCEYKECNVDDIEDNHFHHHHH